MPQINSQNRVEVAWSRLEGDIVTTAVGDLAKLRTNRRFVPRRLSRLPRTDRRQPCGRRRKMLPRVDRPEAPRWRPEAHRGQAVPALHGKRLFWCSRYPRLWRESLKSATLTHEETACLPGVDSAARTARIAKARLARGQSVCLPDRLRGAGRMAARIVRSRAAMVSGTCGGLSMAEARRFGASQALDHASADLSAMGRQRDVVFDAVGTLTTRQALCML